MFFSYGYECIYRNQSSDYDGEAVIKGKSDEKEKCDVRHRVGWRAVEQQLFKG